MIENENRNAQEALSIEVAEASREQEWKSKSFMGSMFMGDFDITRAYPFPEQRTSDAEIGDEICSRVDAWCQENVDGERIDQEEEIPAHVWKGLADLGLFGIKIPTEYGGLGLSQTNYMRVLATVGRYCGSVAATLSAHQSIGVPQPLKMFGTDEQKKKYLPLFAKGAVSAFALTEPEVGSDPANMSTVAELSEDGTYWTLNGDKLWCTNGVVADVLVVMARTPSKMKNGREIKQISAFIVDTDTPGIDLLHRCRFMGIRAIENGLIRFTNVRVPAENLIWGEGNGLRLALSTLNDGRLSIPAICASLGEDVAAFCARWAKSREQWGKSVGSHEAGSDKLARISGGGYAMSALSAYCAALSDAGDIDIRMEAATAKMFNTELFWDLLDDALQLRGGRGYETEASLIARGEPSYPLERLVRDARINRIVEGTTDVMHLFLAREALDPHLRKAGGLFKRGATTGDKIKTLLKAGVFYAGWYPKLWLGGLFRFYSGFDGQIAKHLRWVERRTRKLARALFHRMIVFGPKLEMRQMTLARIIDIGAELAVMGLVAARAQSQLDRGDKKDVQRALLWLTTARNRVDHLFWQLRRNADAPARSLAKGLMDEAKALPAVVTDHLQPLPHEKGLDLTSGKITKRTASEAQKANAATGPVASKPASQAAAN